ncbi:MAG: hypothetical protein CVV33_06900, partial [Methanomicrobiales archaeon HGW-Methanomicrobiales-4]
LILGFFGPVYAEPVPDANNNAYPWNGTWVSDDFTLFILQNVSEISGDYVPLNFELYDPGHMQGTLSEDGKTFSGICTEKGFLKLNLSDDEMSFSGVGVIPPLGSMSEPYVYERNGTRSENLSDLDNKWSGTWTTPKKTFELIQNGTYVFGTNEPLLPEVKDEPGLFEGTVSEDGKTITLNWLETGNFTFTLSDDGSFFNGTYHVEPDPSRVSDSWNGTKIR